MLLLGLNEIIFPELSLFILYSIPFTVTFVSEILEILYLSFKDLTFSISRFSRFSRFISKISFSFSTSKTESLTLLNFPVTPFTLTRFPKF